MILASSMNDQRWASSATLAVAAIAVGASLYYLSKKEDKTITEKLPVPYASAGILQSVKDFGSPECPLFLLKCLKEAKDKGCVDGSFRLPLRPGGVYVVASYRVCR